MHACGGFVCLVPSGWCVALLLRLSWFDVFLSSVLVVSLPFSFFPFSVFFFFSLSLSLLLPLSASASGKPSTSKVDELRISLGRILGKQPG